MREVCFCGWSGEIADRLPIYRGDGEMGLACPDCGDVDRLDWLPEAARRATFLDAVLRQDAHDTTLDRAA
jgi:hypothetical protein